MPLSSIELMYQQMMGKGGGESSAAVQEWVSSAVSAPVIAILAFFSTPLLGLLGGKTFRGGSTLLILLALSRAAAIAAPPFSSALIAMGKPSRSIAVNLASNLLLLPLLPLFLLWFGLDGAGWHSLLQASLAALALAAMVRHQLRAL